MYEILFTNHFKRSYKRCLKRGCDKALFEKVVTLLAETGKLPGAISLINCQANGAVFGNAIPARLVACLGTARYRTYSCHDRHGGTFGFIRLGDAMRGISFCDSEA